MRAVVDVSILDEDDSDDDMMRFKKNEKPSWSSLISLVHVLPCFPMVSTCCPYSPVLQEERLALHKLGIHMRAVVV